MVELPFQGKGEEHRVAYRLFHCLQPPVRKNRRGKHTHRHPRQRPLPRWPGIEVAIHTNKIHPQKALPRTGPKVPGTLALVLGKTEPKEPGTLVTVLWKTHSIQINSLCPFAWTEAVFIRNETELLYKHLLAVYDVQTCGQTFDSLSYILA